jgi:hypothetical protein
MIINLRGEVKTSPFGYNFHHFMTIRYTLLSNQVKVVFG